jgi:hypothetical protein
MIRAITIAAPAGKLAGRVLAGICKNSEIISGSFAVGLMCELWRGKVPKNFQLAINLMRALYLLPWTETPFNPTE